MMIPYHKDLKQCFLFAKAAPTFKTILVLMTETSAVVTGRIRILKATL